MINAFGVYFCVFFLAHNGAGYPQQTYANPIGGYPGGAPNYAQNVPQPSVTNNFYPGAPQQSSGGGGGGGFLQTALAAGAGSLAGNALYGALKPDSEKQTVIIHENAPAPQPAAPAVQPAVQPAAPQPAAPQPGKTNKRKLKNDNPTSLWISNIRMAHSKINIIFYS